MTLIKYVSSKHLTFLAMSKNKFVKCHFFQITIKVFLSLDFAKMIAWCRSLFILANILIVKLSLVTNKVICFCTERSSYDININKFGFSSRIHSLKTYFQ